MNKYCWAPHPINIKGINRLEDNGISVVAEKEVTELACREHVVAAIFRTGRFTRTMMEQLPHLQVIAVHGVGTDGIDISAATEKGIVVLNTPGINSRSVAEHALALMFDLAKKMTESDRLIRQGDYITIKNNGHFREILGLTLGIIGFGAIGLHLAKMASALGMEVLVLSSQSASVLEAQGYRKAPDLEGLLQESDFVSLHAPSTAETYHMMNTQRFSQMKRGACLINTSRGALIDETALTAALQEGIIAGAALDVFEHEPLPLNSPLLAAPNIIMTPHTAASTNSALENMSLAAAEGVLAVLQHTLPASLINPAVWQIRRRG